MDIFLSDKEIEKTYKMIEEYHRKYLEKYGVHLPSLKRGSKYTKDALVLVYLAYNYPNNRPITKKELTEFIRSFYSDITDVQQARHFGRQKGWYIVSSARGNHTEIIDLIRKKGFKVPEDDFYYLVSLEEPYPGYKKRIGMNTKDFEKLKKLYGYRCATCGSEENKPNLKNPQRITKLQKAHINPRKPEEGFIPQCEECNRAYRDWFVFDKEGKVRTIANPKVVLRADKEVQREIYELLKKKFAKKNE